jgi:hypothetical protein
MRCTVFIMYLLSLSVARPSLAGSWSIEPNAAANIGYDDNVRMSIDRPVADRVDSVNLAFSLTHDDGQFQMALDPRTVIVRYREETILNRNDVYVAANANYRSERSQWPVAINYVRDTTLTSELGTTGLTETNRDHESESIVVSPTWQATERFSVIGQASWEANAYLDAADTGLVDYDYQMAMAKVRYAVNERSFVAIDSSYGKLLVPSLHSFTTNYAANISWQTTLLDRWQLSLAAGPARVETAQQADDGRGYSLTVMYQAETTSGTLTASRDVIPTGRGILTKRERATLEGNFSITERLTSNLSLQFVRNEDLYPYPGAPLDVIRYAIVSGALQWRIVPTLFATLAVNWSNQSSETRDGTASGHSGSIGISWNGLRRAF